LEFGFLEFGIASFKEGVNERNREGEINLTILQLRLPTDWQESFNLESFNSSFTQASLKGHSKVTYKELILQLGIRQLRML